MAGIVRKIDELGRIVIPKEIRRTMLIREGEQLEMSQISASEIVVRKYSQLETVADMAEGYCTVAKRLTGHKVLAVDKSSVLAVSGASREYVGDAISTILYNVLVKGEEYSCESMQIVKKDTADYHGISVYPIVSARDVYGGIIALGELNETDKGVLRGVVGCMAEGLGN